MGCVWRQTNPVLAGLLGFIHGAVCTPDQGLLRFAQRALGNAGAEGDQYFFVVIEKVFFGEVQVNRIQ